MPYGLTNAQAVFQSLINEVFRDMLNRFVIAYIDDSFIYSANLTDHIKHVRSVLFRLLEHNLYAKLEKCEFHRQSTSFLGYIILEEGVEMDQSKVTAVTSWPEPTSVKDLQRFLGFTNFYRTFIHNYSAIAGPLTSLLKGKPKKLVWTDKAREAFQKLKLSFTVAPILCHRHPDLPFVVEVDASSCGISAVLSQHQGDFGKLHPCAYFSR